MKKFQVVIILFLSALLFGNLFSQDKPSLSLAGQGTINNPTSEFYVIYDQMNYPGTNSITSQNYESSLDNYDSFAADDFALMDMTWNIESIDVLGVYSNGSGPANSVNVWIYNCNGSGGLPIDIVYSALNLIPSAGLMDGSFSIPLPVTAVLNEGWYWLCVQANMDYAAGGQWLWTERTLQDFSESAWKNPGGGFGTPCTPNWGYRVTNCAVGTQPDNCFRFNGFVTPVELISYNAETIGNKVVLNWSTATETNNKGFSIERTSPLPSPYQGEGGEAGRGWENIGYVPGFGTATEIHLYSFIDEALQPGNYQYRLKQIDFDGTFEYSNTIEVTVAAPTEFSLEQNYPNPFNPTSTIQFQVPNSSFVNLKVYDVLGNEVATLVNEQKPTGTYEVEFDGTGLPSGVYFYQLKASTFIETKKMILLR